MVQNHSGGAHDQIVFNLDRASKIDARSLRKIELDRKPVSQTDGLKDSSQLMETVGTFVQNTQIEIELREGRNDDLHD